MSVSTSERRAAILTAALACFTEKGYDRTTTAAICARAGVSSGTFFHHFPTKSAVLVTVLADGVDQARGELAMIVEKAGDDADAALGSWIDRLVAEAEEPHLAGLVSALGASPDDPDVDELLGAESALAHASLTALIVAGQQQGRWSADRRAERSATWVGLLADGVLARKIEDPGFDVRSVRDELADVVRRILG